MTEAETIRRAWIVLVIGLILLAWSVFQLWMGKAFVGYDWRQSAWALRKKEPGLFWGNILVIVAAGLFAIGLALTRLF
ncbi:MAG TPA: hypothetical protein VID67_07155 [Rhizomicrobium sp.]|jgi:hypothetical protein